MVLTLLCKYPSLLSVYLLVPGRQCCGLAEAILCGEAQLLCGLDRSLAPPGHRGEEDAELALCFSQVQIKTAKQRVVMASLYLGTGLLEQELVSAERLWGGGERREKTAFAKSLLFLQAREVSVRCSF